MKKGAVFRRENSLVKEFHDSQENISHLLAELEYDISPFEGKDMTYIQANITEMMENFEENQNDIRSEMNDILESFEKGTLNSEELHSMLIGEKERGSISIKLVEQIQRNLNDVLAFVANFVSDVDRGKPLPKGAFKDLYNTLDVIADGVHNIGSIARTPAKLVKNVKHSLDSRANSNANASEGSGLSAVPGLAQYYLNQQQALHAKLIHANNKGEMSTNSSPNKNDKKHEGFKSKAQSQSQGHGQQGQDKAGGKPNSPNDNMGKLMSRPSSRNITRNSSLNVDEEKEVTETFELQGRKSILAPKGGGKGTPAAGKQPVNKITNAIKASLERSLSKDMSIKDTLSDDGDISFEDEVTPNKAARSKGVNRETQTDAVPLDPIGGPGGVGHRGSKPYNSYNSNPSTPGVNPPGSNQFNQGHGPHGGGFGQHDTSDGHVHGHGGMYHDGMSGNGIDGEGGVVSEKVAIKDLKNNKDIVINKVHPRRLTKNGSQFSLLAKGADVSLTTTHHVNHDLTNAEDIRNEVKNEILSRKIGTAGAQAHLQQSNSLTGGDDFSTSANTSTSATSKKVLDDAKKASMDKSPPVSASSNANINLTKKEDIMKLAQEAQQASASAEQQLEQLKEKEKQLADKEKELNNKEKKVDEFINKKTNETIKRIHATLTTKYGPIPELAQYAQQASTTSSSAKSSAQQMNALIASTLKQVTDNMPQIVYKANESALKNVVKGILSFLSPTGSIAAAMNPIIPSKTISNPKSNTKMSQSVKTSIGDVMSNTFKSTSDDYYTSNATVLIDKETTRSGTKSKFSSGSGERNKSPPPNDGSGGNMEAIDGNGSLVGSIGQSSRTSNSERGGGQGGDMRVRFHQDASMGSTKFPPIHPKGQQKPSSSSHNRADARNDLQEASFEGQPPEEPLSPHSSDRLGTGDSLIGHLSRGLINEEHLSWPPAPSMLRNKLPSTVLIFPLHTATQSTSTEDLLAWCQPQPIPVTDTMTPSDAHSFTDSANNSIIDPSAAEPSTTGFEFEVDTLKRRLEKSKNPLHTLYTLFLEDLSVVQRYQLLGDAVDRQIDSDTDNLQSFEALLSAVQEEISKLEHTSFLALQNLKYCHSSINEAIVLKQGGALVSRKFLLDLSIISSQLGEIETSYCWCDMLLAQSRVVIARVKELKIDKLIHGQAFQQCHKSFLLCQSRNVELRDQLSEVRAKYKKYLSDVGDLMKPVQLGNFSSHSHHQQEMDPRQVSKLKDALFLAYQEIEELKAEIVIAMEPNDHTPGALLFFSLLHDPQLPDVFRRMISQLNEIKDVVDGKVQFDFISLKRKLEACFLGIPSINRLLQRFGNLYKKWSQLRVKYYLERNQKGGDADLAFVCPICNVDQRESPATKPTIMTKKLSQLQLPQGSMQHQQHMRIGRSSHK